ncbi:hypothetical protein NE463_21125, partial [Anaerotruncus colihominis]|nr:hypothetical protein [Anaerotruncus colihominis]
GEQAKTLKRDIPCIVADKRTHAEFVIRALKAGIVPGRDIGCSPVNLSIARALRLPMDLDIHFQAATVCASKRSALFRPTRRAQ